MASYSGLSVSSENNVLFLSQCCGLDNGLFFYLNSEHFGKMYQCLVSIDIINVEKIS